MKPDLNPLAEGKRIRLFLFNDSIAVAQLYFNKTIEEFKRLIPLETAWVVSSVHDEPRLLGMSALPIAPCSARPV